MMLYSLPNAFKMSHHLSFKESRETDSYAPLQGFPSGASTKEPVCQCRRQETRVRSLGREDPLALRNPLRHSCLENPKDIRAWRATVHAVARSRTRLKRFSTPHFQDQKTEGSRDNVFINSIYHLPTDHSVLSTTVM